LQYIIHRIQNLDPQEKALRLIEYRKELGENTLDYYVSIANQTGLTPKEVYTLSSSPPGFGEVIE